LLRVRGTPDLLDNVRLGAATLSAHLVAEREDVARGPVRTRGCDERAAAGDAVDEALVHEALHSRAPGHPRDLELCAELCIRRKRRMRVEFDDARTKRLLDGEVTWDEVAHASTARRSASSSGAARRPTSTRSVACMPDRSVDREAAVDD